MLVIATNDFHHGLCRMWEAFTDLEENELRIFRSAESADNWLRNAFGIETSLFEARTIC
jgi:hypothetical protein